jgi:hypothetical protein
MEFIVEARSKRKKAFVERILPNMIKQLGLTKSRKVLVVRIANECGDDNDGMTAYLKPVNGIVVILKPKDFVELGVTLAHEMVHVKQLALGILKTENGINYWRGKRYTRRTKYLDMPWEIDAYSKQELIFRRAIEK